MAIKVELLGSEWLSVNIYNLRVNGKRYQVEGYWEGSAGFTIRETKPRMPKSLAAELEEHINEHPDEFTEE